MSDQMKFVGTIFLAASRLGIAGGFNKNRFVWFDPVNGVSWECTPGDTKKDILFNAANSLRNYLSWWTNISKSTA